MDSDVYEFCEDYAISISKFLKDNYDYEKYPSKKEKRNKKNRIKHDGIKDLVNVISVPLKFAYRYKELVFMGKLLIVKDDFNYYQVYINPKIIVSVCKRKEMDEDMLENIRLIKHFKGQCAIDYNNHLLEVYELQRRKNDG